MSVILTYHSRKRTVVTVDGGGPKKSVYEQIGQAVAHYRTKSEISQAALAAAIGLTRTSISNIEKGRQKMLVHTLLEIADALSVSPADLIPNENNRLPETDARFSGSDTSPAERATISALLATSPSITARRTRKVR